MEIDAELYFIKKFGKIKIQIMRGLMNGR